MKKKTLYRTLALVLTAAFVITAVPLVSSETDADSSFTVTDTTGETFNFSGPVDKVVVFGYAATLTVLDSGAGAKLVATDKYGMQNITGNEEYSDLNVETIPTLSSTNTDALYTWFLQAVEDGKFSLTDCIILTTYTSSVAEGGLRDRLEAAGFTHVVFYGSMKEYSDLIQCVDDICSIVGASHDLAKQMQLVSDTVSSKVASDVTEKRDAIFIWYSAANGWGAGNTGSLAVSMMNVAGANNIAYDSTSSSSIIYDESRIQQLLGSHTDTVIFLDGGYIRDYGGSVDAFVNDVLGGNTSYTILVVEKTWNNYDPESADGIWEMASALYPSLFTGSAPTYSGSGSSDNSYIYAAVAGVVIIIAAAGLLYLYKAKH